MKKLASTLPNMIISLVSITVVAGALLGITYSITKQPIALQQQEQQQKAIAEVAPNFDNDPESEKWNRDRRQQLHGLSCPRERAPYGSRRQGVVDERICRRNRSDVWLRSEWRHQRLQGAETGRNSRTRHEDGDMVSRPFGGKVGHREKSGENEANGHERPRRRDRRHHRRHDLLSRFP